MFTVINENDITFVDEYEGPCMGCNKTSDDLQIICKRKLIACCSPNKRKKIKSGMICQSEFCQGRFQYIQPCIIFTNMKK